MPSTLRNKNILVGIGGGIAAYKMNEFVRLLKQQEAVVHTLLTKAALNFVSPLVLQTLSGNSCLSELFNLDQEHKISHITLADEADAYVIAPASADLIARLAQGLADDLVTTVALATCARILVVPAMNVNMWEHPATQRNVKTLLDFGYTVLEPASGELACGWEGKGRLPELTEILDQLVALL